MEDFTLCDPDIQCILCDDPPVRIKMLSFEQLFSTVHRFTADDTLPLSLLTGDDDNTEWVNGEETVVSPPPPPAPEPIVVK